MFDRFGVGSPSPFGVRGGILAIGVHAAILGYGLKATTGDVDRAPSPVVDTMMFFPSPQRPGVSGSLPVVPVAGPIDIRIPDVPITIPTIPGGTHEPGPITMPSGPVGPSPIGDPNGVFDTRVVEQVPELLSSPPLRYPEMLRLAHVEGTVVVQGVVDTLGHLEPNTLKVMSSPHPGLSAAATECLSRAVFRPGRFEGRAVRVLVQVPVRFTISGR